ncbi:MAG: S-layer homology domain-containing protein [Oscillospiraceae bacterium]|nr:S-layer homology domain-containing protein [Oscillospiraceae bacterium]
MSNKGITTLAGDFAASDNSVYYLYSLSQKGLNLPFDLLKNAQISNFTAYGSYFSDGKQTYYIDNEGKNVTVVNGISAFEYGVSSGTIPNSGEPPLLTDKNNDTYFVNGNNAKKLNVKGVTKSTGNRVLTAEGTLYNADDLENDTPVFTKIAENIVDVSAVLYKDKYGVAYSLSNNKPFVGNIKAIFGEFAVAFDGTNYRVHKDGSISKIFNSEVIDSWTSVGGLTTQEDGFALTADLNMYGRNYWFDVWLSEDDYWNAEWNGDTGWEIDVSKAIYETPYINASSSWAVAAVNTADSLGLSTSELSANYQATTTRAEFCRAAVNFLRKFGYDVDGVTPKLFADTTDRDIGIAAALGVTSGTDAAKNLFSPDNTLTREQAAGMLRNVLNVIGADTKTSGVKWTDADSISSYTKDAADVMYTAKIMGGTSTTALVFSPKTPYTHEQSIGTLVNLWEYLK